jgi:hypothetical protein
MEHVTASLHGIYRDILIGPDGRILENRGWVRNTIVNRCRMLLAGFIANHDATTTTGIEYLAVGQGSPAWDTDGIPASDPAATTALQDLSPVQIPKEKLDIVYLDASDEVAAQPSNRIQITATLPAGFPALTPPATSYPLREFSLFGRFDNADFMINSIRHPVIHKDRNASLIRVIRLYF